MRVEGEIRVGDHPDVAASLVTARSHALAAVLQHWPEYLIEALGLGLFMLSACLFVTLLEHPNSPIRQTVTDPFVRRIPMGLAMGLTAVGLIYSAWGQRSGTHFNPSVTLTFWRLGKVTIWDAFFYLTAQFIGAIVGVGVGAAALDAWLAHPAVSYAATVPGPSGAGGAFVAELLISFFLMIVVLTVSNRPGLNRFTGLCAGALVASYIVFEAPACSRRPSYMRPPGECRWSFVPSSTATTRSAAFSDAATAPAPSEARAMEERRCRQHYRLKRR